MAPYVMKVEIYNRSDDTVQFIGASTLTNLDGKTSVNAENVSPNSLKTFEIVKSGGTAGLFTALSWAVPGKVQFSVHSAMPATAGQDIFVGLRDITGMSWPQFQSNSAADTNESVYRGTYKSEWVDEIKKKDLRVSMVAVNLDFPNSHYCVYVVSKKYSDENDADVANWLRKMATGSN